MIAHDSHDVFFRSPVGAGVCSGTVALRLRCDEPLSSVDLRVWWNGAETLQPMVRVGNAYECTLRLPETPGLLWYCFLIKDDAGARYYGNAPDGLGGVGELSDALPPSYQITVYDPEYDTPRWMRNGLLYQIFPDRFCASRPAVSRPAPAGGHWHADWYEPPELNVDPETGDNLADDFFGGDLRGVVEKLPYLKRLGVTAIYFNPLFKARSNHKYDVGDYREIDPSFGTEADFTALCRAARALGIRVLLDGVFSHTGADSVYFDKSGAYGGVGAYQAEDSPYSGWYRFEKWPDAYECWWGFKSLPCLNETDESFLRFAIGDRDSVCAHWLRAGASGWRLDVADELPMPFIRALRARLKALDPDAALLGEVWEDASNKVAYGETRAYCLGDALDSCMNYPLRDALLRFLTNETDAGALKRFIAHEAECYPKPFLYAQMNLLGSHDKPRVISLLSGAGDMEPPRAERKPVTLTEAQYALGRARFLAAWRFLCALPGMPSLYYADEVGAQGMSDPYCRGTYPWGREDAALREQIARINNERMECDALRTGETRLYAPCDDVIVCARRIEGGVDALGQIAKDSFAVVALNRARDPRMISLAPDSWFPVGLRAALPALSARRL